MHDMIFYNIVLISVEIDPVGLVIRPKSPYTIPSRKTVSLVTEA